MQQVVIYDWPKSQLCAECENSTFIQSTEFINSNYICLENYLLNDGITCEKMKIKEEIIDNSIADEYDMLIRLDKYDKS